MANEKFGTLLTESMGGYTWYKNSRLNRVTSWENNATMDIPTEIIYLKNMESKKVWSLGLNPKPDNNNYNIVYGFGYAKYIHKSDGIEQELEVYVPKNDSIKVGVLKLNNTTKDRKKIKIIYYAKPVIGEDIIKTNGNLSLEFEPNSNIICISNLYTNEMNNGNMYVSCSEKIKSYTGDKGFFLGKGGLQNPDALKKVSLNNEQALGRENCVAYEVEVEIDSFSAKEISILLGAEENKIDCKNMAYKYSKLTNCKQELAKIKNYWKEVLRKITSLYTFRINEYNSKWMDSISNTFK